MYSRLNVVCFSPAGSTKAVALTIAASFPVKARMYDLTDMGQAAPPVFDANDFVIFAVPAFGGRVPPVAVERLRCVSGTGAQAAAVVTYGHRAYDDTLLELRDLLETKGFVVIGGGAFVTKHTIVPSIGADRPNKEDQTLMTRFGQTLEERAADAFSAKRVHSLPGHGEYRPHKAVPVHPVTTAECEKCGVCARHCPTNAIPTATPQKTDRSRCICCMRCVAMCPKKARGLTKPAVWVAQKLLEKKCAGTRTSEIFLE